VFATLSTMAAVETAQLMIAKEKNAVNDRYDGKTEWPKPKDIINSVSSSSTDTARARFHKEDENEDNRKKS
jgi:hypothetical protein